MQQIFMGGKPLWTNQSQKEEKLQELQQIIYIYNKIGCRSILLLSDICPLKYKIM